MLCKALRASLRLIPSDAARLYNIAVDGRVLAFAMPALGGDSTHLRAAHGVDDVMRTLREQ